MKRPPFYLAGLLFGASGLALGYYLNEDPPMTRDIVTITTHLGDHAHDFYLRNNQTPELSVNNLPEPEHLYSDTGTRSFQAFKSRADNPEGYVLNYEDGNCQLALPAGRSLIMSYRAGFFVKLHHTLPLKPVSFDEIMEIAENIGNSFDKAGWKKTKTYEVKQETFGEGTMGFWEYFGQWTPCNRPEQEVYIQIKAFNKLPTATMTPPVPLGPPIPEDAPERYILEVSFYSPYEMVKEAGALMYARRLAVHGNKNKRLTLKDWIEDPDWRPEGWDGKFIK